MKVYKNNSNPLVEVPLYALEDGVTYIEDTGMRVKYNERNNEFDIIQISELVQGNFVDDLTDGPKPSLLALYWTIMNNKDK